MLATVPLHPTLVVGDIFSVEQLVGRGVFSKSVFRCGARVHEGLGHHRQASVGDAAFVDVENKLRILDDVDPEPKRKTGHADGQS